MTGGPPVSRRAISSNAQRPTLTTRTDLVSGACGGKPDRSGADQRDALHEHVQMRELFNELIAATRQADIAALSDCIETLSLLMRQHNAKRGECCTRLPIDVLRLDW